MAYVPSNPLIEFISDVKALNKPFSIENFANKDPFYFYEMMCYVNRTPTSIKPMEMTLYIDSQIMKLLLEKWDKWEMLHSDTSEATEYRLYCNLNQYLRFNLKYIIPVKEEMLKKTFSEKHSIKVNETYKTLKTLFYYEPYIHHKFFNDKPAVPEPSCKSFYSANEKFLMNYPHMATKIEFPNFKAVRYNKNHDAFKLINLKTCFNEKDVEIQPLGMHYKNVDLVGTTLQTWFFSLFLQQLQTFYEKDASMPLTIKNTTLTILEQFKEDFSNCGSIIQTHTMYKENAVQYPYVRYLGQPTNTGPYQPHVLMQGQLNTGNPNLNLRLQQITYPAHSFILETFTPKCMKTDGKQCKFEIGQEYLEEVKFGAISFECTLCKISGNIHEMRMHLSICHGAEPDWACTSCLNVYSTKYLCMNSWRHECFNL